MRMVDQDIQPGQRWVSDAEPELGLGVVMSAGNGRVSILFPAADDRREYALDSAPVRRVAFEVGDNLKTHDGISGSIEEVKEEGGFLHYQVKGEWIPEAALADTISFSSPLDRLMGRQLDEPQLFNVRNEALAWQSRIRKAPNRGFTGGRVDLIEHQLYLAQEVTNRLQPRVLLADEVGLGKNHRGLSHSSPPSFDRPGRAGPDHFTGIPDAPMVHRTAPPVQLGRQSVR
jgi:ATP-dependent helicase HepA